MRLWLVIIGLCCGLSISAQEQNGVTLSGSVQSDILLPQNDDKTGAQKTEDLLTNTYLDLMLQSRYVDAGVRLEYLEHPLPGFENDFEGWGVPHFWVKGQLGCAELTAGTFYEQFGSGFHPEVRHAPAFEGVLKARQRMLQIFQPDTCIHITALQHQVEIGVCQQVLGL